MHLRHILLRVKLERLFCFESLRSFMGGEPIGDGGSDPVGE